MIMRSLRKAARTLLTGGCQLGSKSLDVCSVKTAKWGRTLPMAADLSNFKSHGIGEGPVVRR